MDEIASAATAAGSAPAAPSRAEVESLKRDWAADPCWDLEETPGFEEFRDELTEFAARTREKGERRYRKALEEYAERIGVPGNLILAERFRSLERRVAAVENRLDGADDW